MTANVSREKHFRLPSGFHYLEAPGGHFLFQSYDGVAVGKCLAWITEGTFPPAEDVGGHGLHEKDGKRWYGIEFPVGSDPVEIVGLIREAIKALRGY